MRVPPIGATLTAFFEDENRLAPFGFRGELARRLLCWDGLSIADFVYAADDRGIAACVAPWSPVAAKQTVVSRVPATLRLLGRGARALPSPPIRVPEPGEPLRMPYLTHLTFASRLTPDERARSVPRMLDHLFDRGAAPTGTASRCATSRRGTSAARSVGSFSRRCRSPSTRSCRPVTRTRRRYAERGPPGV